ncbi:hypothetical protein U3A55_12020 [Salarchaeum sp. III]|uniref:hypothetical protein n=1 Tax=Salarchaeum sp. III TaxID=3107927 RepID=UPI002EDB83D2
MSSAHPTTSAEVDRLPWTERTVRAAGECMVVHEPAPGLYDVYSEDGSRYRVEPDLGACECGDAQYRDPEHGCKHLRRVRLAIGAAQLPAGYQGRIDPVLEDRLAVTHGGQD